jgi:hypothetical protein
MKNYTQGFYLEGLRGNNVFSYDKRGAESKLYVPAVKEGILEDVRPGMEVVFSDEDEFGVLQECKGLEAFIRTSWEGVPMVVVDNHNHVFYFWMEAYLAGKFPGGASLVHVDGHKDMREPAQMYLGTSLEEAFEYTNFGLNVGNYIVPAMKAGLVSEAQFVTSEVELENGVFFGKAPKILNLDLDFFAPELDYIDFEKAKRFILRHAREASLITVATSPFFITQERAIQVLHRLFD